MPFSRADPGALPTEFAVFPLLGAILLPRGKLPLNIFEPRYLAMTEDALASGRMFGMIQPDLSAPPTSNGPAMFRIGCLGRLSSFSETDDGRFLITLHGLSRFTITEELPLRRGYRRVHAEFEAFPQDRVPEPSELDIDRTAMLNELRGYFQRGGMDANWEAVRRLSDDALITALSMICPFAPAEKQALLEAADDRRRADILMALLRMGGRGEPEDGRKLS
jgi:Lon protease-like protein